LIIEILVKAVIDGWLANNSIIISSCLQFEKLKWTAVSSPKDNTLNFTVNLQAAECDALVIVQNARRLQRTGLPFPLRYAFVFGRLKLATGNKKGLCKNA
jgi:hypothetical protein